MPVNMVQVMECECTKCGYRWINRENGGDRPIPSRCAKCKRPDWELGNISRAESWSRYKLRHTFTNSEMSADRWSWITDPNVDKLLKYRPSIEEMNVILEPMCYLLKNGNSKFLQTKFESKSYKSLLKEAWSKDDYLRLKSRLTPVLEKKVVKIRKARAYQLQLSRQLIEYFLEKYSTAAHDRYF
jgi:hypothetical protein